MVTTWRIFPNSDPDPFSQAIVIVVVVYGVVGTPSVKMAMIPWLTTMGGDPKYLLSGGPSSKN